MNDMTISFMSGMDYAEDHPKVAPFGLEADASENFGPARGMIREQLSVLMGVKTRCGQCAQGDNSCADKCSIQVSKNGCLMTRQDFVHPAQSANFPVLTQTFSNAEHAGHYRFKIVD